MGITLYNGSLNVKFHVRGNVKDSEKHSCLACMTENIWENKNG